jgi:hypothetical protein
VLLDLAKPDGVVLLLVAEDYAPAAIPALEPGHIPHRRLGNVLVTMLVNTSTTRLTRYCSVLHRKSMIIKGLETRMQHVCNATKPSCYRTVERGTPTFDVKFITIILRILYIDARSWGVGSSVLVTRQGREYQISRPVL